MRQQVQIIGGEYRSRRLKVINADGLRPTSSRMREMLFNWLQMEIPGAIVVDLFAGTGALGIEALSRGAKRAIFIEKNPKVFTLLKQNLTTLKIPKERYLLLPISAESFLQNSEQYLPQNAIESRLHLFLDPPFFAELYEETLTALKESRLFEKISSLSLEMPAQNQLETSTTAEKLSPLISYRKKGSRESMLELFIRPQ